MSIIHPMEKIKNFRMKINLRLKNGLLKVIPFNFKVTDILKVKEWEKICHGESNYEIAYVWASMLNHSFMSNFCRL